MIIVILLLMWIGIQLDAPDWYKWALGILAAWHFFIGWGLSDE